MNKGVIFKLTHRPATIAEAMLVRYYLKICAHDAVIRVCEDMQFPLERVVYNCEPIYNTVPLDYEQTIMHNLLNQIEVSMREAIYGYVSASCSMMPTNAVLNITVNVYDSDQILLSYEVYYL